MAWAVVCPVLTGREKQAGDERQKPRTYSLVPVVVITVRTSGYSDENG